MRPCLVAVCATQPQQRRPAAQIGTEVLAARYAAVGLPGAKGSVEPLGS
jgi:hypothetical protein